VYIVERMFLESTGGIQVIVLHL